MPIGTSIPKFERFFRLATGLDIDKEDLKRFEDFINRKIRDLVVRAEAFAKANTRDIIMPYDLPITRGLQDRMHEFRTIDAELGLEIELDRLVKQPPTDFAYFQDTEADPDRPCTGRPRCAARACRRRAVPACARARARRRTRGLPERRGAGAEGAQGSTDARLRR